MLKLLPFLMAAALFSGCASKLDAPAAAQNATNVRSLVATVAELHVKAHSDPAIANADAVSGESFIRLADAIVESAK